MAENERQAVESVRWAVMLDHNEQVLREYFTKAEAEAQAESWRKMPAYVGLTFRVVLLHYPNRGENCFNCGTDVDTVPYGPGGAPICPACMKADVTVLVAAHSDRAPEINQCLKCGERFDLWGPLHVCATSQEARSDG